MMVIFIDQNYISDIRNVYFVKVNNKKKLFKLQ